MESGVPADPGIAMEINGETRPNTILGMIPRVLQRTLRECPRLGLKRRVGVFQPLPSLAELMRRR